MRATRLICIITMAVGIMPLAVGTENALQGPNNKPEHTTGLPSEHEPDLDHVKVHFANSVSLSIQELKKKAIAEITAREYDLPYEYSTTVNIALSGPNARCVFIFVGKDGMQLAQVIFNSLGEASSVYRGVIKERFKNKTSVTVFFITLGTSRNDVPRIRDL